MSSTIDNSSKSPSVKSSRSIRFAKNRVKQSSRLNSTTLWVMSNEYKLEVINY